MSKRTIIISTLLGAAISGVLTAMFMQRRNRAIPSDIEYHTHIEVRHDTLVKKNPVPTITTRHDTVVRLMETIDGSCDVVPDTIAVKVPLEHKVWQDSDYRIAATGYEMSLDTVEIFRTTTTIQPTLMQKKHRRWGLSATAGIGITPAGVAPFVGIGISYTFLSF